MQLTAKKVGMALAVLAIGGFLALLGSGLLNQESVTSLSGVTRVQKPAPPFTLPLFGGEEFKLADHRGQPMIINFWASWCLPCRQEMPVLQEGWQSFRDEGVVFVGVDIQDSNAEAKRFLEEYGVTYPNGRDVTGEITVDYGVVGIPVTYFVNKEGVIARRFVGAISRQQLIAWTEELVAGDAPIGPLEQGNPEGFQELER